MIRRERRWCCGGGNGGGGGGGGRTPLHLLAACGQSGAHLQPLAVGVPQAFGRAYPRFRAGRCSLFLLAAFIGEKEKKKSRKRKRKKKKRTHVLPGEDRRTGVGFGGWVCAAAGNWGRMWNEFRTTCISGVHPTKWANFNFSRDFTRLIYSVARFRSTLHHHHPPGAIQFPEIFLTVQKKSKIK